MPVQKGYPKNKVRDMEVSAVKGATPRAYETHPRLKGDATKRGVMDAKKIKLGKIPNR